jgi:hypothetical protein
MSACSTLSLHIAWLVDTYACFNRIVANSEPIISKHSWATPSTTTISKFGKAFLTAEPSMRCIGQPAQVHLCGRVSQIRINAR